MVWWWRRSARPPPPRKTGRPRRQITHFLSIRDIRIRGPGDHAMTYLGTTGGVALDPYIPIKPCHQVVQVLCPSTPNVSDLGNVERFLRVQRWVNTCVDACGPHLCHHATNLSTSASYGLKKQLLRTSHGIQLELQRGRMYRSTELEYRNRPVQVGLVQRIGWRRRYKDVRREHGSKLGLRFVGQIEELVRVCYR